MKHLLFFLPLLFIFFGCSESNDEPNDPTPPIIETPVIASHDNPDGTYYTLHDFFIRLRKADGSVIAEHEIKEPDVLIIQKPYGEQSSYRLYFNDFYVIGNSVVVIYKANDADQTLPIDNGYSVAYIFSKDLKNLVEKKFTHGQSSRLPDGETVVVDNQGTLYAYDVLFDETSKFPLPSSATKLSTHPTSEIAIGKVAGKYYVFGDISNNMNRTEAIIANYSDGVANTVYKPYDYTIVQDFFPEESNHYPRLESQDYSFEGNKFFVTYHYTKYSGEKVDAVYSYDVNGNQLSPAPAPERVYIAATHLTNMMDAFNAPSNIEDLGNATHVLIYPYGGTMTVSAIREIYGRSLNIEFEVDSSDSSMLEITNSSPSQSYSGDTTFKLTPKQKGRVDIIFNNPDYGVIETWHVLITDVK